MFVKSAHNQSRHPRRGCVSGLTGPEFTSKDLRGMAEPGATLVVKVIKKNGINGDNSEHMKALAISFSLEGLMSEISQMTRTGITSAMN